MMAPAGFEADSSGQKIDFDEYRALVGKSAYVSQQVRPWHASVRDCLCWAVPDASESMMWRALADVGLDKRLNRAADGLDTALQDRSEEHTSELQSLMRISYAAFCLKKKHKTQTTNNSHFNTIYIIK